MLGDDIVVSETPCLKQLINEFEEKQSSIIGVQEVADKDVSKYGVISPEDSSSNDNLVKIKDLVENLH